MARWGVALIVIASVGYAAQAMNITFVGQEDNVQAWRSTSVAKAYDVDGDGYYGTEGYVLFAAGMAANGWSEVNPFLHANTVVAAPGYATMQNAGMNVEAHSKLPPDNWYPAIDDPQLLVAAVVADISSGMGLRNNFAVGLGQEAALMDIVFTADAPALRIGVMGRGVGNDQVAGIRLQQTAGAGSGNASMTVANGAPVYFAFFDVIGAKSGDTLTVKMTEGAGGNQGIYMHGLALDVIPEPAVATLLLLGGLVLPRRRRA